jgi:hypothetical protein
MSSRFLKTKAFLTLPATAVLLVAAAAMAQLSETPPVNMGLWQTEIHSTVTGVENTPMAAMASSMGRAMTTQSCLTPDRWKSDIEGMNDKRGCTLSNVHQDSHEVSFDQTCEGRGNGMNSSHVDILIDSQEHAHGTIVTKFSDPRMPQPVTVTANMVSQYLGSACGDVKPGEGKIVH